MKTSRGAWSLAGIVAGLAGLATSYVVAMVLTIRESPVVAVAEMVIRFTPGALTEKAISVLGTFDKTFLVLVILLVVGALFAWAGRLARRSWWAPSIVYAALAAVGVYAVSIQRGSGAVDMIPVAVGFVTWLVVTSLLTEPLQRAEDADAQAGDAEAGAGARAEDAAAMAGQSRRAFVVRAGLVGVGAVVLGVFGRVVGAGRRQVEETRRLLKLSGVHLPQVPASARVGLAGVTPWMTKADDFYRIATTIQTPTIEPSSWSLRIHGMVDREVVVTYDDLVSRELTEGWITLNCVSNPVGGTLIGNAWWSGVRIADLLAMAGVQAGADAVKQTSEDGWTCGTPLSALTDDRNAMLAVAMNGEPLPIDHGFPVRSIVPGLYGYVSATKWVVDFEVTRFADFQAYWTQRGWGEQGPVKMSSRVDVPVSGEQVTAGEIRVGGVAWSQHTGISAVEFAIDGGEWQPADISDPGTDDAWVQWAGTVTVDEGDHLIKVRATDKAGLVQTGAIADVLPDGATGWNIVDFSARS